MRFILVCFSRPIWASARTNEVCKQVRSSFWLFFYQCLCLYCEL